MTGYATTSRRLCRKVAHWNTAHEELVCGPLPATSALWNGSLHLHCAVVYLMWLMLQKKRALVRIRIRVDSGLLYNGGEHEFTSQGTSHAKCYAGQTSQRHLNLVLEGALSGQAPPHARPSAIHHNGVRQRCFVRVLSRGASMSVARRPVSQLLKRCVACTNTRHKADAQ